MNTTENHPMRHRRIAAAFALLAALACRPSRAEVAVRELGDRFDELNTVFATVTDTDSARFAKPTLIRLSTQLRTIGDIGPLDPDTARRILYDPSLGPRLEKQSETFVSHLIRLNTDQDIRTELADVLDDLGRLRGLALPPH
jgi:hypothetical protein